MIKLPGTHVGSNNKIFVGMNIGDRFCQISYCDKNGEVETISALSEAQQYSIPTALCKRDGVNQWFCGREAVKYAVENGGILVDRILSKAIAGETVMIEDTGYKPVSILSLFIKRCLSMVTGASIDRIDGILFTSENMTHECAQVIKEAVMALKIKTENIFFQGHSESFYHFMIHQKPELWNNGSVLFEYSDGELHARRLEANLRTAPVVVYIGEYSFDMEEAARPENINGDFDEAYMDNTFLEIAKRVCESDRLVSVYLIGEDFSDKWMNESKKYLCSNYRVFQGSNLYSKGACYGILDRLFDTPEGTKNIFLGSDKLTANIGMNILRQGEPKYFAILDAGTNWYDVNQTFDFYLEGGNTIDLKISSIIDGSTRMAKITLEEFSGQLSRLRARFYMEKESLLVVEIEDFGLGAFRAASHKVWTEKIPMG